MAEKPVRNRSSEGVVAIRHPRTDFPQQGWLGKGAGAGVYYEASVGFGWWSETQSFRPNESANLYGPLRGRRGKNRGFYQTEPQQGWIGKPNLTGGAALYEAGTGFGWWSETQSFRPNESANLYGPLRGRRGKNHYFYQTQQEVINFSQAFDPALQDWCIDSGRTSQLLGRFLRDTNTDVSWLFPTLPVVFDPAIQEWTQSTDRTAPGPRYRLDTNTDISWIFPNLPAFDPALQDWTQATTRTATGKRYQRDTNTDVSWIFPTLPVFDPATCPWAVQSDLPQRKSSSYLQRRTGPAGFAVYDPAFWPATTIHSYRLWKAPKGLWQPDLDNAWIQTSIPPPFDATTQFAALGIPGTRTTARARLLVSRYQSFYDLSFVHDVIPLTDPVAATVIHLRPIAPIMSARRRNKKRR